MQLLQFTGALELGLIYGLVALAAYITFRVINFPDLTVDGSFTLGAAVSAILILKGIHPVIATLSAFMAGIAAGSITGYLHVRWHILGLLASILTMVALYSVNLRIMGQPNLSLLNAPTLLGNGHSTLLWMTGIVALVLIALNNFLNSQFGLALRATGINPQTSRSYGVNVGNMTIFGLALSNGIVALAGSLFAQIQGFADIAMGTGTVIVGLVSVIVGETCLPTRHIQGILISCLLGSIIYRIAIAIALNSDIFALRVSDLNLITAVLVVVMMFIFKIRRKKGQ